MSDPQLVTPADARWLRTAAACVLAGLVVEVISVVATTPVTFLLFLGLGLPLLGAGGLIFLLNLWRVLVRRGAL